MVSVRRAPGAINIISWDFVKNQRILMQFLLLDLKMNSTCDSINFNHLT